MATMSMNKVIHGAFRRDLDRFVGALETFRAGDSARASQLGTAWDNFDQQLTDHHEGEHAIAWPALEQVGVPTETLAQMDAEHSVMADALDRARVAMDSLRTTAGAGEAERAATALRRLRDVTLEHLDHEEREVEPVYLANLESPAIKDMGRRFARAQSPPHAGRFFAWLTDGASAEERAAISEGVPRPVLAVLSGVFGRGYRKKVAPTWRS
jgi:hemerythrin-like domain-containing protein